MPKDKYDILAHAWRLEDEQDKKAAKKIIEEAKPWKSFKEDVEKMEKEILVSHYTPDNIKKQTKKIVRVRGKKQYLAEIERDEKGRAIPKKDTNGKIIYKLDSNGEKIPRLQQGDTVRGSLHLDTIYGAIERENENGIKEIKYVVRKPITKDFSESDVKNIVDEGIKNRITKYGLKNLFTKDGFILLPAESKSQGNEKDLKEMLIKKVRLFQSTVKNPLNVKKHSILSKSRFEHKQKVYAINGENYSMAIYEGLDKKGNVKRGFELLNYMDAGSYYKLSNDLKNENTIVPSIHLKNNLPLKYLVKKGDLVLFFKESKEELLDLGDDELVKRLYKVIGFESDGRIQFRFHKTAMQQSSTNKDELTIVKYMADNNLKNSQVDYENPVPWLRLTMGNFNFLLNDIEFKISDTGKIEKL